MNDWPPSNYPFLIALLILTATAVALAIGDEELAENLAIYVYYSLISGVAIRFSELVLPEDTMQMLNPAKELQLYLRRAIFKIKVSISVFERQHPPIGAHIRKKISFIKLQYLKRFYIVKPGKNISLISDISWNTAILLSVFLIISLAYGITIDMQFVKRYLDNLILIIIGWLALYILLRVRFYTGKLK